MSLQYGRWNPTFKFRIKKMMKTIGRESVFVDIPQQLHFRSVTEHVDHPEGANYISFGRKLPDELKWMDIPTVITESDEYE